MIIVGVFPFTAYTVSEETDATLPLCKEMAYDFQNNCLLKKAGKMYQVYKDEAIKVWIYKALKVKRYVHPAYTHAYGNEIENIIGKTTDRGIFESESKRYITECLMTNPYIQEVSNFSFDYGDRITITFDVTTIYGRFTYESEVYNE